MMNHQLSTHLKTSNRSENLVMLVYTSKISPRLAVDSISLNTTTTTILGQAQKNNPDHQITGVLYYGNQRFFQCIEGPEPDVRALFNVIKKDSRHREVNILTSIKSKQRLFASWAMKFTDSNDLILNHFKNMGLNAFYPEKLSKNHLYQLIYFLKKI